MHETCRDSLGVVAVPATVSRVAVLSVHTCPLDQPGTGDSGGMNVYIRQVSRRLAEMGVCVDVFTRASSGKGEWIHEADPGVRVVHLEAGPDEPIPKGALHEHLCTFLYSLLRFEAAEAARLRLDGRGAYDVVHSHYWLSGWVGRRAAERWRVPLLHSFHTLGRVKNRTLADGDPPEPPARIAGEERIAQTADVVLAPTSDEADDLVRLYGADPANVSVVSPGVDVSVFSPDGARAPHPGGTLILFVGRLQPLKGPDVAVRAVASLAARAPSLDPHLVILGGPSGGNGMRPDDLTGLAASLGIGDRVRVCPPVPQDELARWYRAADVVLIPSHSESFGLVALEAAACGTPVVASDVGGLRTTVRSGLTGLLVEPGSPDAYAGAMLRILSDPASSAAMADAGTRFALRFDWRHAAAGLLNAYEERAAEPRT